MDGKYTRLKLKMLLLVVLGTLIAGGVGIFLLEVVVDGVLQDPFARFFLWAATTCSARARKGRRAYRRISGPTRRSSSPWAPCVLHAPGLLRGHGPVYPLAGGDPLGHPPAGRRPGRSRWRCPGSSAPIQEDLNAIRRQLLAREAAGQGERAAQGDLVAFLAHDLKTPLTSVVGYLTLLRDDPGLTPEQRAKFTGVALDKARRLEELLGEFFDITRMDLDSGAGGSASPSSCPCCWSSSPTSFTPSLRRSSSGARWKFSTTWWCWGTRTNLPGSSITCCATPSATLPPAAGWTFRPKP